MVVPHQIILGKSLKNVSVHAPSLKPWALSLLRVCHGKGCFMNHAGKTDNMGGNKSLVEAGRNEPVPLRVSK